MARPQMGNIMIQGDANIGKNSGTGETRGGGEREYEGASQQYGSKEVIVLKKKLNCT